MMLLFAFLCACFSPTDELIRAGQFLHQYGLTPAGSGNLSIRINECIAITASGKHKGHLKAEDIVLLDSAGKSMNGIVPSAETLIHLAIYAARPVVGAVLHTHSLNGTILSRLLKDSFVTDGYEIHKALGETSHESQVVVPIFENSQDMEALSSEIGTYLSAHPETCAILVRGHGFTTWGKGMEEAKARVEAFEYLFAAEISFINGAPPAMIAPHL